jgi:hypothetical protein
VSEHVGTGPHGQNLLGFLCSVGVLAALERIYPEHRPKMRWQWHNIHWHPVWSLEHELADDELIAALQSHLTSRCAAPEFTTLGDRLPVAVEEFHQFAQSAAAGASPGDRTIADFAAAFGCEALTANKRHKATKKREAMIQDTPFRTVNTGKQRFLAFIRTVHAVTVDEVREAIIGPWRYQDAKPSLRWDPIDARDGAISGKQPRDTEILTVRAANALASEALRLFPTAPTSRGLLTTGFAKDETGEIYFSWPIWTPPIGPDVLRSLVAHPELIAKHPDRQQLQTMGVALVYRSRRIELGRKWPYRNFSPARPV